MFDKVLGHGSARGAAAAIAVIVAAWLLTWLYPGAAALGVAGRPEAS